MRFWLILGLVLGIVLLSYQFNLLKYSHTTGVASALSRFFDGRVHYRIGHVDPRFGLSESQVKEISREASNIWQHGTGKDLFVEDDRSVLTINLIFDARQQQSNQRHEAQHQLQHQQAEQIKQTREYDNLKKQLRSEHQQLVTLQSNLEYRLNQYNQTVQSWNSLGKIDSGVRNQLKQQRQIIDQEQRNVQTAIEVYNQHVQQTNQKRQHINALVDQINQTVAEFNQRFSPREFEKGQFNGKNINIYEFDSLADLRLTIAHEMGHALGLQHNNDPEALMYPLLKQQDLENFQLKQADLAMLR